MMQMELQRKNKELAEMSKKLELLESRQKECREHPQDERDDDDDNDDEGPDGATAAIKQKVRRMCRRRANGSLIVPEAVHQAWKNPGPSRDNVIKLFMKNGCQKDPMFLNLSLSTYIHIYIYIR